MRGTPASRRREEEMDNHQSRAPAKRGGHRRTRCRVLLFLVEPGPASRDIKQEDDGKSHDEDYVKRHGQSPSAGFPAGLRIVPASLEAVYRQPGGPNEW